METERSESAAPPRAEEITRLFERYRILEGLSEGASPYLRSKAFDERLGVVVHLDVLPKLDRFVIARRREFSALQGLEHPAIVKALDFYEDDQCAAMATEWIDGSPIANGDDRAYSVPEKINLLTELAETLDFALRHGIGHPDIRPRHILVLDSPREDGTRLAVRGFEFAPDSGWGAASDDRKGYFEHLCYSPATRIVGNVESYSWGVIAFELLSGKLPFCDDDAVAVGFMHRELFAPSLQDVCDAPSWLAALVGACLAKQPDKRPEISEVVSCLKQQSAPVVIRRLPSISVMQREPKAYKTYIERLAKRNAERFPPSRKSDSFLKRLLGLRK